MTTINLLLFLKLHNYTIYFIIFISISLHQMFNFSWEEENKNHEKIFIVKKFLRLLLRKNFLLFI